MLGALLNKALDWERSKYFIRLSAFCCGFGGKRDGQLHLIGVLPLLLSLGYRLLGKQNACFLKFTVK